MNARFNDDPHDFAAQNFGDAFGYDSVPASHSGQYRSSALDSDDLFDEPAQPAHQAGEQWGFDSAPADEPDEPSIPEDTGDAEAATADAEEFSWEQTTVTNPPETVSVTALMDGKTLRVDLEPGAAAMTEAELAAEILVIADVAGQQASSVLHTLLLGTFQAQGLDTDGALTDRLGTRFLGLTSPQQAAQAQAEAFATRYPQ